METSNSTGDPASRQDPSPAKTLKTRKTKVASHTDNQVLHF
jgi:hypothetical protein